MLRFLIAPLLSLLVSAFLPPPMPMAGVPVSPNTIPDGITVRGIGNASAMADQATISLRLFSRNNALSINDSTLQPVVDALVRAGIGRSDITTPMYLTGAAQTNNATVTAVVHHPTVAMLQNGIATLAATFPSNSQVLLNNAEVRLSAADCAAARSQAQASAIHQARTNARSIAHDLGVRVGPVIAVDFQSNPFDPSGGCFSIYNIGPYQNSQFNTPEDYLRVRVSSVVTIRFAIK